MQNNNPTCPDCGCYTVKSGYQLKSGIQIYKCKNCGKRGTFTGNQGGRPKSIVTQCKNCGNLNVYAKGMCEPCYRRDKRLKTR
jgi:transposase-like protein